MVLASDEYGLCGSQSALPAGCHLDDVTVIAVLWTRCVLHRMEVSFAVLLLWLQLVGLLRLGLALRFGLWLVLGLELGLRCPLRCL